MRREFLLNILFLVFVNLLIKPFFIFGIDRTIQNRVGLEDYGIYAALFNFTFLLHIINDFGLPSFTSQRLSQNRQLFPVYLPNIFGLKLILSFAYAFIVLVSAYLIGYEQLYFYLIGFLLLNQVLRSFLHFFRSNISGLGYYRMDSLMTVVERLILIFICAFLLWFNPWDTPFQIEWFIYAQTLSLSLSVLIAGGVVFTYLKNISWRIDTSLLLDLLQQSAPYALVLFLMTIYTRLDFVMIERLAPQGKTEAGIYATAYRLLDAVNMIGVLFSGLLLPMLTRLINKREELSQILQISTRLMFWGTIAVTIIVAFFRMEIMQLLYTHTDQYAADILGILIFTFILVGGGYIYGTLLIANDSLTRLNKLFLISVFLNLILNYLVIPTYGAKGAAMATLVTQGVAFLGQLIVAKKALPLKWDFSLMGTIFLYTILTFLATYIVYYYMPGRWELHFMGLLVLAVGIGILTRLLNIKLFFQILTHSKQ